MIDVLIIGAGPTGTTLAIELARSGVTARIIDRADGPFTGSRGKGITARSQEIFDDLGIVAPLIDAGFRHLPMRVSVAGEIRSDADPMAERRPTPEAPYESGLILPQWRTEQILRDRLATFGAQVEYGTAAAGFTQHPDRVEVRTDTGETITARYVIGADGGRSTVRGWTGARFEGHSGEQAMLVADVHVDGLAPDRWYQWSHPERGFIALCPFRCSDTWQFQVAQWSWFADGGGLPEPTTEVLQGAFDEIAGLPVRVHSPTWTSQWRVNVRLADRFRDGRILLAGDAAHVHPPAGGLGMNTGIQDAHNLGWKLAAVLRGGDPALLDTYAEERVPVAQWTLGVSSTELDNVTSAITSNTSTRLITPIEDGQQLGIGYRWSRLSVESAAFAARAETTPLRAGDRAPDGPCAGGTLFDAFRGPHATVIAVGTDAPPVDESDRVRVIRVPEAPAYTPDQGLFVVRPDGHIGFAGTAGDGAAVREYLALIGAQSVAR